MARVRAKRARGSARRKSRKNPAGAVLMSKNVISVRYRHAQSAQRVPYEHGFGSGVEMWALRDGSLLLRSPGHALHGQFTVRDSE